MKRNNLKKLALLGFAGASLFAAQGHAEETPKEGSQGTLMAHSCGSGGGCASRDRSNRGSCANVQRDRQGCGGQRYNNWQGGYVAENDMPAPKDDMNQPQNPNAPQQPQQPNQPGGCRANSGCHGMAPQAPQAPRGY